MLRWPDPHDACRPVSDPAADRLRVAVRAAVARWDGRTVLRVEVPLVPVDAAAWLGAQALGDNELLAIVLGHGRANVSALDLANDVLNGDGVDLGGTIAEPQMAHIARHKPFLRKQFRRG